MRKQILLSVAIIFFAGWIQAQQNVLVSSINFPSTACGHTASENVNISLFNPGPGTVPAVYTIGYSYYRNGVFIGTVTQAAVPGDSIVPFFPKAKSFSLSANMALTGVYTFKAFITYAGDPDHSNDTLTKIVNSDPNTVPGVVQFSDTVCTGANGATLNLVGNVGAVVDWIKSINGGATWVPVAGTATIDSSFAYLNLTQTTEFAAVVRSGSCPFDTATPARIQVDAATIPGTITGAGNVCIGSSGTLNLTGSNGTVIDWVSSQNANGPWNSLSNTGLSQAYTNLQITSDTLYKVYIKLGVCPLDSTPIATFTLDQPSIGGTVSQIIGNDTVCSGFNAGTLLLTGKKGTVLNWEVSTGGPFNVVPASAGLTSLSYTNITATATYRAVVKNGNCPSIVSTNFTITVDALTVGGTINSNATICSGGGGSLTLVGNVGAVVRWEQSINGGATWTPIANTTNSLTYGPLVTTTLFRAQVKNGYCAQLPSASATITVSAATVGGTVTQTIGTSTVCSGSNTGTLSHAGGTGSIVQWEFSINGGASFNAVAPLNTSPTLVFTNITVTTIYRVQTQNAPCAAAFSNNFTITVLPATVPGTIAGAATVCTGSTVSLTLSGHSGTINKWQVSINGGGLFTDIPASAGLTNIVPTVSVNSLYRVEVQNGACAAAFTPNKSVNVDPVTVPGAITADATVCGGANSGTLNLAGHTGTVIGWIQSTNGGSTWTAIGGSAGAVSRNYTNLTLTTIFRARIKSGVCAEDTATGATITVIPAAVGGTATISVPNDTVCAGSVLTVMGLNSTQTGNVLAWEFSINGGALYTVQPTSAADPYAVPAFPYTTNTLWRAHVQNGAGCPIIKSTPALMTVNAPSVGGTTAGADSVCGGSNNGFVTLSGHNGAVQFWEASTNSGATWTPQPSSASTSFNYIGLNNTTWFRAIVKNGFCAQAISDTVIITIIPAAVGGTVTYVGGNVCSGSNLFTLNLSGSSGAILGWQKSTNGGVTFSNIVPLNTTLSHIETNITQTTHYRVVLQSGACPSVNSAADTVVVDPVSNAGTVNGSTNLCGTGNAGMIFITGYTGSVVGWRSRINAGAFTPTFSVGQDTINYLNLIAGNHQYEAIVKSGVCPNDTSSFANINVDPPVVPGVLSGGTSYCTLTNSTLIQLNGFTDSVVVWQRSTNGGATFTNIAGTNNRDTVTFVNVIVPTIYRVIVTSGNGLCGNDTSNTQTIGVGQSVGGTLSSSNTVCISGHTGLMQLSGYTGSVITWQDSISNGSWVNHVPNNAGIDTLRYTNLTNTTSYRVIVQSGSCTSDTSTFVTITVNDTVFAGTLNSNVTFCDTTNADTLLLTGYFGPILNWQTAINGGPFVNFAPVKTDSAFIYNNIQDSITTFRVIMNGGVCGSDTSNIVTVNVNASLGGILMSGDTLCSGNNDGVLKLVGYKGTILGWDSSTVAGIFAPIGHTIDSLIFSNINDTTTFRVRVQNIGCPVDTSSLATIVTIPGTSAGNLTGSRSFCNTTNTDSVILVGRQGSILLWESSINNGGSWNPILGQTTDTLIFTNLATTTWYRVIIDSSGSCPKDTSNIAIIQVGPSDAGTISGDTQLCANSLANLMLSGYTGNVVVWEISTNGGVAWNPIPSSDTSAIQVNVALTSLFRAIVKSDTCSSDTSSSYSILVDQPYTDGFLTPTTQLCYGIGSDTMFLAGVVDTIFDWEFRADTMASFLSLSNTTNFQTYDTLKITHHYRVFVKRGVCPIDTANITLTVDTFTLAGSITGDDTICAGINNGTILLSGHIGNTFTWQSSLDGNIWGPAPGATNDTFYVYNNLMDTTFYRLIVASGGCPPDTTNSVLIVVKPSAIGGTVMADTSYCEGPNAGVLKLIGHAGNINGWQQSTGGPFSFVVPSNTTDSLTYVNVVATTSYRVILSLGDCPDDTSTTATITILSTPVTSISPSGPTEFCEGDSVILTASGGPDYLWNTLETTSGILVNVTGLYSVVVTDTTSLCTTSDSIQVTVFPAPTVDAGSDATITEGQSITLNASGAASYVWTPKTALSDGFVNNPTASPSTTTIYHVSGTDANGCVGTDSVTITVIPDPTGGTQFTNLFTPNGDGHNDFWSISGIANCTTCQVTVFNRYGQEILSDGNYQNNWTGTYNGKNLPDGTYYYIIKTESDKIYKGAITILRGE